jgi:hypothetical protein
MLFEEPPVIEFSERVGGGIELQFSKVVVLHEDWHAEVRRRSKYVNHSGLQRNGLAEGIRKLPATLENLVPILRTNGFAEVELSDRFEKTLQELAARNTVKVLESLRQQLEKRILGRGGR